MTGIVLQQTVFDCPDHLALARFYADLTGGRVVRADEEWADVQTPAGSLGFQKVAGYRPPSWPDGVPQQLHLDFEVTEFASTHAQAVALGAVALLPTTPPRPGDPDTFRVYADPAGHPFCLCLA